MKFRSKASDQVSGFLDKGTSVTGELTFAGTLRIDGNFHGSISSNDILVIGEHAVVHADIKVGEVEIHGQVFGSIDARRRTDITATGRFRGDVHTPVLCVTPGGVLDGRIQMAGDHPVEDTTGTDTTTQQKTHQERGS
jgi:cytoskeletal protein CcmA (bactofilin family)